jgi:hypothetical protein
MKSPGLFLWIFRLDCEYESYVIWMNDCRLSDAVNRMIGYRLAIGMHCQLYEHVQARSRMKRHLL